MGLGVPGPPSHMQGPHPLETGVVASSLRGDCVDVFLRPWVRVSKAGIQTSRTSVWLYPLQPEDTAGWGQASRLTEQGWKPDEDVTDEEGQWPAGMNRGRQPAIFQTVDRSVVFCLPIW